MKLQFQAGRNRCVSVPPEKRFLINKSALIEIGKDHRLADPEPLVKMLEVVERVKEQQSEIS